MTEFVKMKAKTTFHNDRIRIGDALGGTVSDGDPFETDPNHAKDLARLGHAEPVSGKIEDIEGAPLEPHHQVSQGALAADRARRKADAGSAKTEGEAGRRRAPA